MTDLGNLGGCAGGTSVNASLQAVGSDGCGGPSGLAFLSQEAGPVVDLNTLVPPNSGLQLYEADQINDRGEIAAQGVDASGNYHAVLLIPCDENHPGVEGCDYSMVDLDTLQQSALPATQRPAAGTLPSRIPTEMLNRFRSRWSQRTPVSGTVPTPAAEQTSAANTASVDVEGEQLLGPLSRGYGFCLVSGGKLTGYCTKYYYLACAAKPSTACPRGQTAKRPGYFQCSPRGSAYVDLARYCVF